MAINRNSVKHAVLKPEFRKKSHSKRKAIFIERTMKKTLPLLRDFHQQYGLNATETELKRMGREYASDLADKIRAQKNDLFLGQPVAPKDFNALVDTITEKVEAFKAS